MTTVYAFLLFTLYELSVVICRRYLVITYLYVFGGLSLFVFFVSIYYISLSEVKGLGD